MLTQRIESKHTCEPAGSHDPRHCTCDCIIIQKTTLKFTQQIFLLVQGYTQYVNFTLSFPGVAVTKDAAADNGYRLFNTANDTQLNYPFFLAS